MSKKGGKLEETPKIFKMMQGWWVYAKPTYYSTKLFKLQANQHFVSAVTLGNWRFIHSVYGAGWVSMNIPTLRVTEAPEDELREIIRLAKEQYDAGIADSTVDSDLQTPRVDVDA